MFIAYRGPNRALGQPKWAAFATAAILSIAANLLLTAPAAAARGVRRSASAKASSLKGTVTFMPRPPAARKARTVAAKPSSGASRAS